MGEAKKTFLNLFAQEYKGEVMRELLDNPEYQWTVNELVGEVSASYNTVDDFLRELSEYDIVRFQKKGNYRLVTYNPDNRYHDVIKSLFQVDVEPLRERAEAYAHEFYGEGDVGAPPVIEHIVSFVLFGSVARGSADADSDIDILILVHEHADINTVKQWAEECRNVSDDFDRVVPVVERVQEFRNNYRHGKRFETNVMRDGVTLQGAELDEAIRESTA